jgi:hypothetical protein
MMGGRHQTEQRPLIRLLRPLTLLAVLSGAVQASPFSFDPVSFAGFANETFKQQGKGVFVKNLGTCRREGKDRAGYRCLSGELLQDVPARKGREFCRLDAIWYVPFSKTVQFRTASCQFKSDQQRMIEGGQRLLRQGLDQLENYGK